MTAVIPPPRLLDSFCVVEDDKIAIVTEYGYVLLSRVVRAQPSAQGGERDENQVEASQEDVDQKGVIEGSFLPTPGVAFPPPRDG